MKSNNNALDPFICPTSGRLATENSLPDLTDGLVMVGDEDNRPKQSSALINMQIDIDSIFTRISEIRNTSFVLNKTNPKYPDSQSLDSLDNGIMLNDGGIIKTEEKITQEQLPPLPKDNLWIGDSSNKAKQSKLSIDQLPLPTLHTDFLWVGSPLGVTTVPYDPVALKGGSKQDKAELPHLKPGHVWVGSEDGMQEMPYDKEESSDYRLEEIYILADKCNGITTRLNNVEKITNSLNHITDAENIEIKQVQHKTEECQKSVEDLKTNISEIVADLKTNFADIGSKIKKFAKEIAQLKENSERLDVLEKFVTQAQIERSESSSKLSKLGKKFNIIQKVFQKKKN